MKRNVTTLALLAALALSLAVPDVLAQTRSLEFIEGNPSCASLGLHLEEYKIESPQDSDSITQGPVTLTPAALKTDEPEWLSFTWTMNPSTFIEAVIVKAGNGANVYTYTPPVVSDTDAPLMTVSNKGISHVNLCVSKAVLPVELTSFEAMLDGRAALLSWRTASETNNAGFEVQYRAARSTAFEVVAFVEGQGTTLESQTYTYRVNGLMPGKYVLRLRQIDFDDTFEYSPEVELSVEQPEAFLVSSAYPNPFNPQASFSVSVKQTQRVRVEVYDVLGKRMATTFDGTLEAGSTRAITIDGGTLPSGRYLLRVLGERFVDTQMITLAK